DQGCDFFRPRNVDTVARACDFHLVAIGPRGIPALEVGVDGPVGSRNQHPTGLAPPRRRGDYSPEILGQVENLGSRHESSLFGRQVGREILMKLCGIEVFETIRRFLDCARLTEIARKALSVVSLILS